MRTTVVLATPPVRRFPGMPEHVFDHFGWCPSDTLTWARPSDRPFDWTTPLDGSDPARMVFVFHEPAATGEPPSADFLPRELAKLHAFGMGLEEEWALAPYAIDDATDGLFERRLRPRDVLWLAADNANALFWGLHDWSHFHNHGPFEARAWTELQCDVSALVWMHLNAGVLGLDAAGWLRMHGEVIRGVFARFDTEEPRTEIDRAELRAHLSPDALRANALAPAQP